MAHLWGKNRRIKCHPFGPPLVAFGSPLAAFSPPLVPLVAFGSPLEALSPLVAFGLPLETFGPLLVAFSHNLEPLKASKSFKNAQNAKFFSFCINMLSSLVAKSKTTAFQRAWPKVHFCQVCGASPPWEFDLRPLFFAPTALKKGTPSLRSVVYKIVVAEFTWCEFAQRRDKVTLTAAFSV